MAMSIYQWFINRSPLNIKLPWRLHHSEYKTNDMTLSKISNQILYKKIPTIQ